MEKLFVDERENPNFTSNIVLECPYCNGFIPINKIHYCEKSFNSSILAMKNLSVSIYKLAQNINELKAAVEEIKNKLV